MSSNSIKFGFFVFLVLTKVMIVRSQVKTPLLLSPYLDRNDISKARQLSYVNNSVIKELAGLENHNLLPESYAGFITVNKSLKNNMFFWFFESTSSEEVPLLLWLNGGPGVTSMLGLLWEHGPVQCKDLYGALEEKPYTWTKFSSVLYVDNPIGTGYSHSETSSAGTFKQADITRELFNFLEQFFKMFPEYQSKDFYIGGQSYAGKYVPSIAHYIHKKRSNKETDMPLTGIYLGGPLFDPPTQWPVKIDYYYSLGAVSYAQAKARKELVLDIMEFLSSNSTKVNISEILFPTYEIPGIEYQDNYVLQEPSGLYCTYDVMSNTSIRDALHIGQILEFKYIGLELYFSCGSEFFLSLKTELSELMDNYKVLMYTGDYDGVVTSPMVEAALLSTPWSLQSEYNDTKRLVWYDTCSTSSEDNSSVLGYYSLTGQFCRVNVRGAGHQTPHDQPRTSYLMMSKFIKDGCVNDVRVDGCVNGVKVDIEEHISVPRSAGVSYVSLCRLTAVLMCLLYCMIY